MDCTLLRNANIYVTITNSLPISRQRCSHRVLYHQLNSKDIERALVHYLFHREDATPSSEPKLNLLSSEARYIIPLPPPPPPSNKVPENHQTPAKHALTVIWLWVDNYICLRVSCMRRPCRKTVKPRGALTARREVILPDDPKNMLFPFLK